MRLRSSQDGRQDRCSGRAVAVEPIHNAGRHLLRSLTDRLWQRDSRNPSVRSPRAEGWTANLLLRQVARCGHQELVAMRRCDPKCDDRWTQIPCSDPRAGLLPHRSLSTTPFERLYRRRRYQALSLASLCVSYGFVLPWLHHDSCATSAAFRSSRTAKIRTDG